MFTNRKSVSVELDKKHEDIPKDIYKDAVYFGPTVRFIELDLDNPKHKELLHSNLETFVSDSIYRNFLRNDHSHIPELRKKYTDVAGRLNGGKPFYGMGGCETLDKAARYAYGLGNGIFIGINTLECDKSRIKIHAQRLYPILYGHDHCSSAEEEILHMYLGKNEVLLREPIDNIENFATNVEWAMDSREFDKYLLNPNPTNLLRPNEKIDLQGWYSREREKAERQKRLFMDEFAKPSATGIFSTSSASVDPSVMDKETYLSWMCSL